MRTTCRLIPSFTLALLLVVSGCKKGPKPIEIEDDDPKSQSTSLTALECKGTGTIKGRVTYDGQMPKLDDLKATKDETVCAMGDMANQTWKGKNGGVQNVVVWVMPPKGKCFPPPGDKEFWEKELVIDQPHCAFIPHVSVAFPGYYDPKAGKIVASGQKVVVKNSAPIGHNTKYSGDSLTNPGDSKNLNVKTGQFEMPLKPDDKNPIFLNCNFHPWMSGYVWAFSHPYAAVTDENGNFEIKNVPAGCQITLMAWHEQPKEFVSEGVEVKDGQTLTKDLKVKAK